MHDFFEDHTHLSELDPDAVLEEVEGVEKFVLVSVGIDIGSSTTHLIFSQLTLRRQGASLSGRFKVTGRDILYRSRIMLTPYVSETLIDVDKIKEFIEEAYREAGLSPGGIDTGAVIITGEALKKENAQPIVEYFARYSGKFICAAAGQNHEALLAAYGCGAVDLSKTEHKTVLNVDIGGGTTKFALVENGVVTQTAAVNIGARLIAFDPSNVMTRIEDAGRMLMSELGYTVELGKQISERQKEELAGLMARVLSEIMEQRAFSPLTARLMLTPPIRNDGGLEEIDTIVISGGVSEHVYDRDRRHYGDVGPLLGREMREVLRKLPEKKVLRQPAEGIRATVIGAGEYTVQASGNTSYISTAEHLPVFGLKVVRAALGRGPSVLETLRQSLAKVDLTTVTSDVALFLSLDGDLHYRKIREVAEGIAAFCKDPEFAHRPLYLVQDVDIAKSLGAILKEELGVTRDVIAIDGIEVGDLDYIDIGKPMGNTEVIPVTVKSLMFYGTHLHGAPRAKPVVPP